MDSPGPNWQVLEKLPVVISFITMSQQHFVHTSIQYLRLHLSIACLNSTPRRTSSSRHMLHFVVLFDAFLFNFDILMVLATCATVKIVNLDFPLWFSATLKYMKLCTETAQNLNLVWPGELFPFSGSCFIIDSGNQNLGSFFSTKIVWGGGDLWHHRWK